MNKIKFLAPALILIAGSAFATSQYTTLAQCTSVVMPAGQSESLQIQAYTGPGTIGRAAVISATLTRTDANHTSTLNFNELTETKPNPELVGSGYTFAGPGFSLDICTDCAPATGGGIQATLTYEQRGQSLQDSMVCTLN